MATTTPTYLNDSFKMMTDTFSKAMHTGTKMFEDHTRLFNDFATRNNEQFRATWEKFNGDVMPVSKNTTERFQRFVDEQTRRNTEFFRSTFEPKSVASPAEFADRVSTFWESCFTTMRESTEAFAKVSNDAFQSWTDWNRNMVENATREAPKAAGAAKK